MTQKQKLWQKAKNNPIGLSFEEFQLLLKQSGWTFHHQRGSHQIWSSPQGCRLSIQNKKSQAKAYQVKQFLRQQEQEKKNNAESF